MGRTTLGIVLGLPFIGTTLGAAMVLFMRREISPVLEKMLLGFSSGIMIAASVWSLLIPALEFGETTMKLSWFPAVVGFMAGILFLTGIDLLLPLLQKKLLATKKREAGFSKKILMIATITLHNLPEGMAVGIGAAGMLENSSIQGISIASALGLSLGIGIQNIPEGMIVAMPLRSEGMTVKKSFFCGMMSGVVEPIGAIFMLLFAQYFVAFTAYLMALAAGAMIYVVLKDLAPEFCQGKGSGWGMISLGIGFGFMMLLDVAL